MAKVYKRINGRRIGYVIACHEDVQRVIEDITITRAAEAEAVLGSHEYSGRSKVSIEKGIYSWYIVLDDTKSQDASISIEYGRKLRDGRRTDPVYALRRAWHK